MSNPNPSTNIGEKKNFISSFDVKDGQEDYTIQLRTNEAEDVLTIKIDSKNPEKFYFFQSKFNLIELKIISKAFNYYNSIKEIILAFQKLINKTFEKGEEFIIQIKLLSPIGEIELSDLGIQKILFNHEKIIKNLSEEIKSLKSIINQKDSEINVLTNNVTELKNQINSLESTNNSNLNNISLLKENNINEVVKLNGIISKYQKENQDLKGSISYFKQENQKLNAYCINFQQEYQKLKTDRDNLQKEYKELLTIKNQLNEKVEKMKVEIKVFKDEKLKNKIDLFPGDDSKIIFSMSDIQFIIDYIKEADKSFKFKNLKLLYRGSRDGDRTKTCHQLCDNKQNVLIIIQSDIGNIFGGYSKIGFKVNNKAEYLVDNNCFLFSYEYKKIYPSVKDKQNICHISDYCGLCFTGSLGFFDKFMNSNDNWIDKSNIQDHFNRLNDPCEMNGGKNKFRIQELEVFQFQ
jgi:phage shock protein A